KLYQMPHEKILMQDAIQRSEDQPLEEILQQIFDHVGSDVDAIAHRVVHGADRFSESVLLEDEVLKEIEEISHLAPLHNPINLEGIYAAKERYPDVPQVAVFDTSFHQTMPPTSYLYPIPYEYYEKYRIRKYGFHGSSHRYVADEAMRILKRSSENTNVISAHLGNGASITAISRGRSVDTSMGFTPLEGLAMGTRSGDIDPAILFFLIEKGYSPEELNSILNKKS